MKPYKLKRRQDEQRKRNPSRKKRTELMVKTTKEIALERFRQIHDDMGWVWYPPNNTQKDMFELECYRRLYDDFNFQYGEMEMMYGLFERCLDKLNEDKKKADYIKKKYTPLASDLFEIV